MAAPFHTRKQNWRRARAGGRCFGIPGVWGRCVVSIKVESYVGGGGEGWAREGRKVAAPFHTALPRPHHTFLCPHTPDAPRWPLWRLFIATLASRQEWTLTPLPQDPSIRTHYHPPLSFNSDPHYSKALTHLVFQGAPLCQLLPFAAGEVLLQPPCCCLDRLAMKCRRQLTWLACPPPHCGSACCQPPRYPASWSTNRQHDLFRPRIQIQTPVRTGS